MAGINQCHIKYLNLGIQKILLLSVETKMISKQEFVKYINFLRELDNRELNFQKSLEECFGKENVGYLLYKMNREQIISLYDECKLREQEYKNTDKEIQSFPNYYYKSLKGQLLKGRGPSFFVPKNENIENTSSEEDEEGEEI